MVAKGGIVNRVSKLPQAGRASSLEAQGGTNGLRSLYTDLSADPTENIFTLRPGQRGHRQLPRRHQRQPQTVRAVDKLATDPATELAGAQYEYSGRYDRTPDRGIPGVRGRPADVSRDTTYGDPRDYIDDTTPSPCAPSSPMNSTTAGNCATPWACSSSTVTSTTPLYWPATTP